MGNFKGTRFEKEALDPNILIGKKIGSLTIVSVEKTGSNCNDIIYKCLCDCGNECLRKYTSLKIASSTSCGCNKQKNIKQLVGKQIGKYNIISIASGDNSSNTKFNCICRDCGANVILTYRYIKRITNNSNVKRCSHK